MPPTPVFRSATPADAADCLRVIRRAILQAAAGAYSLEERRAWAARFHDVRRFRRRMRRGVTVVACDGPRLVGLALVRFDGHVDLLFTAPEAVRRGIGVRALGLAMSAVSARGVRTFNTQASHLSRPVFARAGFRVVGHNPGAFGTVRPMSFRMVRAPAGTGGA